MKRAFTLVMLMLALVAFNRAQAQVVLTSDFETWSGSPSKPTGWGGYANSLTFGTAALEYTTSVHGGSKAIQLINATTSHKRLATLSYTLVAGDFYEISFWVRGDGSIRTGVTDSNSWNYNPYYTVNSSSWTHYVDTVAAPSNTTKGEFILSVKSTVADIDNLQVDDVTITKLGVTYVDYSIHDIQYTTDPSGNSPQMNNPVKTGGIVTAVTSGKYFIQSHSGAWNGMMVYDGVNTPAVGDSVIVAGVVQEYNNLTELGNVTIFNIVSSGNPLPGPEVVPCILINSEDYEGVFTRLENVVVTDTNVGFGMFKVFDGNDTTLVDDILYHFVATPGTAYNINGIGYQYFTERKTLPRQLSDISLVSSVEENNADAMSIYPNPVSSELTINVNVATDEVRVIDMTGRIAASIPTNGQSRLSIDFSNFSKGTYYVGLFNKGQAVAHKVVVK
jgi:hypothetical protein